MVQLCHTTTGEAGLLSAADSHGDLRARENSAPE